MHSAELLKTEQFCYKILVCIVAAKFDDADTG